MKVHDGSRSADGPQAEPERVTVGTAEYEVTADGTELTIGGLGSCVGVALYDTETGAAGLVHVMLPTAGERADGRAAKFADTGTQLLVDELRSIGANPGTVVARIAGGSDILDIPKNGSNIGDLVVTSADGENLTL